MTVRRIHVGTIGAPHGVRGEVRVKPFTEEPLALKAYSPLESEDGRRAFKVLTARPQGEMLVMKFEGVDDRDQAAALNHLKLYVPRERLPAPASGEYYQADLIGLSAQLSSGEAMGKVIRIENFGAGDLFEIAMDGRESVFVPFTDDIVINVDLAGGRIVIEPPDGLLDEQAENHDEERG